MTKAEKLKKYKIDLLLRINSTITSMLGTDTTAEELAFAKKLRKENLKKIKEIDPEFYTKIEDEEI